MPFAAAVPLIASGLSGLFGMINNKHRQTNTATSTTTPTLDPAYGPLQQMLISQATSRLGQSGLPANYEANGVNAINRTYDLAGQSASNNLTSRGLGSSPIAGGVEGRLLNGRAGEIGQFRANVPMAQQEAQDRQFGNIAQLLNVGRGSTTTGNNINDMGGGGGLAGAGTNLAQMLGYLMGSGAFGRNTRPSGGGG